MKMFLRFPFAITFLAWVMGFMPVSAEDAGFETEVSFKDGTQFKSLLARTTSLPENFRWSVSLQADAYLFQVERTSTREVLFLWGGSDRSKFAVGTSAGAKKSGLLPSEDGAIVYADSQSRWKTLADVPTAIREASVKGASIDRKIVVDQNVVEGLGTVTFLGLIKIDMQLSRGSGGSLDVQIGKQSHCALFYGDSILSAEIMKGKVRDGLSLGWKKGVLIQCGYYLNENPMDGTFVSRFAESGVTLVKRRNGVITKTWDMPECDNP